LQSLQGFGFAFSLYDFCVVTSTGISHGPKTYSADLMLTRLSDLTQSLMSKENLDDVLQEVLQASVDLLRADFGNVQLLDTDTGDLRIVAQSGFDAEFLSRYAIVSQMDETSCGRALGRRARVVVEDIEKDFSYDREPALRAGIRAVQSTPLVARDGRVMGMISTHWAHSHSPDDSLLRVLDLYARQAADIIEREQHTAALQRAVLLLEETSNDLREANLVKDQFMGMVSHELRTPLSIIVGDARLLRKRRDILSRDDVDSLLNDVADEALRLNDMITHLLGIARSDMSILLTEPLVIGRMVQSVVRDFVVDRPRRPVETIIDDNLPLVTGDADSTTTVLGNLLGNADKFCAPGTQILVRVRHLGEGVMVSVRDRGEAVERDALEKIFEPFYRIGDSTQTKGLGLGLTLCKLLMQKQGGRIWARLRVGGGLSVSIWLPRLDDES
jgi:signal transduction histidine kinase